MRLHRVQLNAASSLSSAIRIRWAYRTDDWRQGPKADSASTACSGTSSRCGARSRLGAEDNLLMKWRSWSSIIESELEAPKQLARVVHNCYFNPQYEEFTSRRMWSLSNAQFADEVFSSDAW